MQCSFNADNFHEKILWNTSHTQPDSYSDQSLHWCIQYPVTLDNFIISPNCTSQSENHNTTSHFPAVFDLKKKYYIQINYADVDGWD